jgi:predicted DNA-binding protein
MVPKTTHYTQTQLERLSKLAEEKGVSEADLLREAMDDFLTKYGVNDIET